ncbi:hypothetical protein D3C81_1590020 [compost metagenome]
MGDPAFREARQVFTGKTVVEHRHRFIGRRQRRFHVGPLEHQRIMRRVEHQRGVEGDLVRVDILRLRPLHQHPPRLDDAPTEPGAQRKRARQRCFGAVPGRRQMIAMHGQNQRIALRPQAKAQVGTFGNDALVPHQPLEAFGQGAAGHQRIAHHVERSRSYHARHVQANGFVARQLHRQQPEPGH